VVTLLTKSGGLLGPIASILGLIMNGIYVFFHLFGIQNIALTIIVFTFIVKILMLPLTIKQQKFTKLSSRMNPELQKIQAKYKGKKDEASIRKMNAEQQTVYQKYGASPTAGCLPLLITLPIMFALYQVIYNIPAYVTDVKNMYQPVADAIYNTAGYQDVLLKLAEGVRSTVKEFPNTDAIINLLAKFNSQHWVDLEGSFPLLKDTISTSYEQIRHVNLFFGLNIANSPGWGFPNILIPIAAMVFSFIQGKQMQVKNPTNNKDNPTANAMNSMNYVMPVMSGFFAVTFPIGVGLYWIATSVFTIIQQYFVNKYLDRVDVDELIQKNVAKASKRKTYTAAAGTSLQDLAKKQTRYIESTVSEKENMNTTEKTEAEEVTPDTGIQSNNPKSIAEIANLLKNRNSEKGDK
jgi:YidC/Oxa1 family membrane protein insertase